MNIEFEEKMLTDGAKLLKAEPGKIVLKLAKEGAGITLPWDVMAKERYFLFQIETLEEHCDAFNVYVYGKAAEPAMTIRFGILPQIPTQICLDKEWLNAGILFPEALPGELKIVCHGGRIAPQEVTRIEIKTIPVFHDITVSISDMKLQDEYPADVQLPDEVLTDSFGQNKRKDWNGKTKDIEELTAILNAQVKDAQQGYPFENWSKWGGWKDKKLAEGTGFFTKYKVDGRWWLADPDGYAFFSMGPDCVNVPVDCRVDGIEKWLEWLPDENDPAYAELFLDREGTPDRRRKTKLFSYAGANLYRVFGADWYAIWKKMMTGQLMQMGMNTLGNWSDRRLFEDTKLPYVTSLLEFPETKTKIFRDFPDVFSDEYRENAKKNAQALAAKKDDPMMIGYFLRNEPSWAFVDNLVLADEVLYNPQRTVCKEKLVEELKEKYHEIKALNQAWNVNLQSFDDLYRSMRDASSNSDAAKADMKAFSRKMLRAYVEIPSKACREVDPNHMILGMRWAWISDPDLVTGWENFDVFSINCYAIDPTSALDHVVELGVDLPVMIGEFHFGALDAGLSATGLEGVLTQADRGKAYRYYCERVAAHPYGVGCHYFQCYDQFLLGRFDGENYNIGLFDICSRPYEDMASQVKACSEGAYRIADGGQEPTWEKAVSVPMIAY